MNFRNSKRLSNLLLLCACLGYLSSIPAISQDNGQTGADNLDDRINRLTRRINNGVKQGTIKQDQADKLQSDLKNLGMQAAAARKVNGGQLKPNDLTGFESQLNQKSNLVRSYNQAGVRNAASSDASGPAWAPGQDGAQDTRTLKRRMKLQEKKQLQQEDQAIMQVKEQQQQEYEKQMLQKLGSQRPAILKNKDDINQVRQDTGAN